MVTIAEARAGVEAAKQQISTAKETLRKQSQQVSQAQTSLGTRPSKTILRTRKRKDIPKFKSARAKGRKQVSAAKEQIKEAKEEVSAKEKEVSQVEAKVRVAEQWRDAYALARKAIDSDNPFSDLLVKQSSNPFALQAYRDLRSSDAALEQRLNTIKDLKAGKFDFAEIRNSIIFDKDTGKPITPGQVEFKSQIEKIQEDLPTGDKINFDLQKGDITSVKSGILNKTFLGKDALRNYIDSLNKAAKQPETPQLRGSISVAPEKTNLIKDTLQRIAKLSLFSKGNVFKDKSIIEKKIQFSKFGQNVGKISPELAEGIEETVDIVFKKSGLEAEDAILVRDTINKEVRLKDPKTGKEINVPNWFDVQGLPADKQLLGSISNLTNDLKAGKIDFKQFEDKYQNAIQKYGKKVYKVQLAKAFTEEVLETGAGLLLGVPAKILIEGSEAALLVKRRKQIAEAIKKDPLKSAGLLTAGILGGAGAGGLILGSKQLGGINRLKNINPSVDFKGLKRLKIENIDSLKKIGLDQNILDSPQLKNINFDNVKFTANRKIDIDVPNIRGDNIKLRFFEFGKNGKSRLIGVETINGKVVRKFVGSALESPDATLTRIVSGTLKRNGNFKNVEIDSYLSQLVNRNIIEKGALRQRGIDTVRTASRKELRLLDTKKIKESDFKEFASGELKAFESGGKKQIGGEIGNFGKKVRQAEIDRVSDLKKARDVQQLGLRRGGQELKIEKTRSIFQRDTGRLKGDDLEGVRLKAGSEFDVKKIKSGPLTGGKRRIARDIKVEEAGFVTPGVSLTVTRRARRARANGDGLKAIESKIIKPSRKVDALERISDAASKRLSDASKKARDSLVKTSSRGTITIGKKAKTFTDTGISRARQLFKEINKRKTSGALPATFLEVAETAKARRLRADVAKNLGGATLKGAALGVSSITSAGKVKNKLQNLQNQLKKSTQDSLKEDIVATDIASKQDVSQLQSFKLQDLQLSKIDTLKQSINQRVDTLDTPRIDVPRLRVVDLPLSDTKKKSIRSRVYPKKQKLYIPQAKQGGKWVNLSRKGMTESAARSRMAYAVDNTTSAQGRIKPTSSKKKDKSINSGYYNLTRNKFRDFKIKKGKKVPLNNQWIEKKGKYRIDSLGEKTGLKLAKLIKQKQWKRKKIKLI